MNEPEVSVIIPVRDGADTIGVQLQALSVQKVDFSWELLVCDNGSTDNTLAIVEQFRDRFHNLRVVDASARRGPAAARNIGAGKASAPLLAFCDADDQVEPDWLGRMRSALEHASIACGGWEGQLLNRSSRFALSWSPTTEYRKTYAPGLPAGAGNNMAVRAEMFAAVGGFDESMMTAEDIDLAWRIQLAGGGFVFVPEAIVHVRRRDGLRSVWRQALSYGQGEFRLKHKYKDVISAYAAEAWDSHGTAESAAEHSVPDSSSPGRNPLGLLRRFVRNGGKLHLVDRLWRWGLRRGERVASADPSWTRVAAPASLPRN